MTFVKEPNLRPDTTTRLRRRGGVSVHFSGSQKEEQYAIPRDPGFSSPRHQERLLIWRAAPICLVLTNRVAPRRTHPSFLAQHVDARRQPAGRNFGPIAKGNLGFPTEKQRQVTHLVSGLTPIRRTLTEQNHGIHIGNRGVLIDGSRLASLSSALWLSSPALSTFGYTILSITKSSSARKQLNSGRFESR